MLRKFSRRNNRNVTLSQSQKIYKVYDFTKNLMKGNIVENKVKINYNIISGIGRITW